MGLFLEHLVPALGVLVANALFFSPLKPVLAARHGHGSFSSAAPPLVFAAMHANTLAWLVYAFLRRDPYILASNLFGALVSQFMLLATVQAGGGGGGGGSSPSSSAAAEAGARAALFFTALLIAAGAGVAFSGISLDAASKAWGWVTVSVLLVFYASPLSALARVLRSRNSSSLQLPFAAMNAANGALWAAYGLAVHDAFVWAPNVVGCIFGLLQVALCVVYPPTTMLLPSSAGMAGGMAGGGGEDGGVGGSVGLLPSRPGSSSAIGGSSA
jgi:solute carrier family 50 protein (sugar transporter)